jgi:hypothetical protein
MVSASEPEWSLSMQIASWIWPQKAAAWANNANAKGVCVGGATAQPAFSTHELVLTHTLCLL